MNTPNTAPKGQQNGQIHFAKSDGFKRKWHRLCLLDKHNQDKYLVRPEGIRNIKKGR